MSGIDFKSWRFFAAAGITAMLAGVAIAPSPVLAFALIGILVVGIVLVVNAHIASPILVVLATPMARPNILGESLSPVAAGLVFLAMILALVDDRGRLQVGSRKYQSLRSVAFWLAIAYIWLLVRAGTQIQPLLQSVVLVVGVVIAVSVVVADPARRRVVAWGFVSLVLIQCASFAVTLIIWGVTGTGTALIALIPATDHTFDSSVYFPGTVTTATQAIFGLTFPRFDGIGREPGWMAMWCSFTYFLIPRLTKRRMRFARLLLLLGLLGTFSTAGFGVFLVVWSCETFLIPRVGSGLLYGWVRQVTGVAVLAGAVWLAIKAPVFGLEAKNISNSISVSDRSQATITGLKALQTSPWGGVSTGASGINLISSIAPAGLPFFLAVLAALFMPLRTHPARWLTAAPVAVLALTLITSQPPFDSTWAFVAALLAYAVTFPPAAFEPQSVQDERPSRVAL